MTSYIFHGRASNPKRAFIPWLRTELEAMDYEVLAPKLPKADFPSTKRWKKSIENIIDSNGAPEHIIGHSLAGHSILDALTTGKYSPKGIYLVAPFQEINYDAVLERTFEELDERGWPDWVTQFVLNHSLKNAQKWNNTPIDWEKVKPLQDKLHLYFSTNDMYVGPEQIDLFQQKLPDADIHLIASAGHFSVEDGYETFPELLQAIEEVRNIKGASELKIIEIFKR